MKLSFLLLFIWLIFLAETRPPSRNRTSRLRLDLGENAAKLSAILNISTTKPLPDSIITTTELTPLLNTSVSNSTLKPRKTPGFYWKSVLQRLDQLEVQLNLSMETISKAIQDGNEQIMNFIQAEKLNSSKIIQKRVTALFIIDVQNDFISGSLSLLNCPSKHNGAEVVPVINRLMDTTDFDVIVYSSDWHPSDHISFFDNIPIHAHLLSNDSIPAENLTLYSVATFDLPGYPQIKQTLWPRHCVQETEGAQLHPDLKYYNQSDNAKKTFIHIYKGSISEVDSYSAFWDNAKLSETELNRKLKEKGVTDVFVTGIATDWCVYSTAVHAIENGYNAHIVEDACRGVDEKTIKERMDLFVQMGGRLVQSTNVQQYLKENN